MMANRSLRRTAQRLTLSDSMQRAPLVWKMILLHRRRIRKTCVSLAIVVYLVWRFNDRSHETVAQIIESVMLTDDLKGSCAINLYGLPRQFKEFVLPSLVENVIKPNRVFECDYFVHFYDVEEEHLDRHDENRGGKINSQDVYFLVDGVSGGLIESVEFIKDTDEEFWKKYKKFLHRIKTATDPGGNLKYVPYNDYSYTNKTIDNVVKMWHSQQAVWNLMESRNKNYSRVAMLRSDVVYVSPVNIYQLPDLKLDVHNKFAVVPYFAQHPVNDRLIYGPYKGVKIWASERFARLDDHAELMRSKLPGQTMHSEKFLYYSLFPAMNKVGVTIRFHPNICFLRARPDESIRFNDCDNCKQCVTKHNHKAIEYLVQRKCTLDMPPDQPNPVIRLMCKEDQAVTSNTTPIRWVRPRVDRPRGKASFWRKLGCRLELTWEYSICTMEYWL